jgi:hypothetical protein
MKAAPPEVASSKSTRSLATAVTSLMDDHRGLLAPRSEAHFKTYPCCLVAQTRIVMRDA